MHLYWIGNVFKRYRQVYFAMQEMHTLGIGHYIIERSHSQ